MSERFDEETQEFLGALDPSTAKLYRNGLTAFQVFYKPQGTIKGFLDRMDEDAQRPRNERKRVGRTTLKEFIKWLKAQGYAPKTVRTYVAAVQSEARYFDIALSTRYTNMPGGNPVSKKEPWTLESVTKFVGMMKKPLYRSIAVTVFQSGLSLSDLLALTYGDIKAEYEAGIVPLCLDLSRIKTDVPFMSFIGGWGIRTLKEHLSGVALALKPGDHLYNISESAIERYFKRQAKKFGVGEYEGNNPMRPHTLRSAFKTLLSDKKVDPLYTEFWMGHRVAEQQRVYVSKSREGWRQTYREQAEPILTALSIGGKK